MADNKRQKRAQNQTSSLLVNCFTQPPTLNPFLTWIAQLFSVVGEKVNGPVVVSSCMVQNCKCQKC